MSGPVFEQLSVGELIAEREFHLTRDSLVRYAGASGDFNPIHYRDDVAQSVGLPGVLAHGMLTMGIAASTVSEWAGGAAQISDYQVRFTRPVLVDPEHGATVAVAATIGAIDTEKRTVRIDLKVVCADQTVLGKSQLVVTFA